MSSSSSPLSSLEAWSSLETRLLCGESLIISKNSAGSSMGGIVGGRVENKTTKRRKSKEGGGGLVMVR